MKVIKRKFIYEDDTLRYAIYFINSKGVHKYMVTQIEDKHIVYSEQFMTECLRAIRTYGEWDET